MSHHHEHHCNHHHSDNEHSCDCCCEHSHNRKTIYIRIVIGFILAAIIPFFPISSYFLLIPYFILGYDVIWGALKNIFHGKIFDEKFLMTIATIGAIILEEHLEACAVMFFYQLGEIIGHVTADKCRDSIKNLFDFAPEFATKITDSGFETVSPSELKPGDKITVLAGEKIPCDGIVYSGDSYLNTSSLTGESIPVHVTDGSNVLGGSINTDSPIYIRVTKEYNDSSVAKVVKMLEEASKNKAESEKFITAFAKKYTPVIVIISLLSAILLPLLPTFTISTGIYTALMFLVISCPCSLVISIPLTLFAGIGNASKHKILFKGNNSLESLYKINNFAFDKTGTLTNGKFSISENTLSDDDFSLLTNIERFSKHPLANIISQYSKPPFLEFKGITEIKGMGISASFNEHKLIAGNEKLLAMYKIDDIPSISGTVIHLAVDGVYKGYVKLSDKIKPEAVSVISKLKKQGANITLLSGDTEDSVKIIANNSGISDFYADLLPDEKVHIANKLKNNGKLCYIGDGINDAPVLSLSDIGISMGGAGSDIAISSSDIIFLDDNLGNLEKSIKISKKTMHIVYQNIILSIGIKSIVLILGFLNISSMALAVFADVGVMIITVLNAIRAMK